MYLRVKSKLNADIDIRIKSKLNLTMKVLQARLKPKE
jgi:hypothetical protein